jgi:hypothetical protein
MRRLHFLLGLLTGLIVAVGIARLHSDSSANPPATSAGPAPNVFVQPVLIENSVPKNWMPKRFNGQTYYLVPIAAT